MPASPAPESDIREIPRPGCREILESQVASMPVDADEPPTVGAATFRGNAPGGCGGVAGSARAQSDGSDKGVSPPL